MEPGDIIIQAGAATTFAKVLVDIVKNSAMPSPSWALPILAIIFGVGIAFLLLLASGGILSLQSASTQILVGIVAGGSAVGVTELQRKAEGEEKK